MHQDWVLRAVLIDTSPIFLVDSLVPVVIEITGVKFVEFAGTLPASGQSEVHKAFATQVIPPLWLLDCPKPEFVEVNSQIVFREGNTKGIGTITKIHS